jgi:hypothetical protein
MFNCMTVQPVMGAERTVFYRERSSAYYAPGPYAVVRTALAPAACRDEWLAAGPESIPPPFARPVQASGLVEVPYLAVQSLLMVCISYW